MDAEDTARAPLRGKVALVTGGARRVGAEIVRTLQ
jgi:NAD(P)-dependent dehydrogenase (short-subunit alcohol dehydrogenase family)